MIAWWWWNVSISMALLIGRVGGQFEWQTRDSFDRIRKMLDKVNEDNCRVVDINELFLPASTVTHVPDIKWLGIDPVFPNRTNLLHVHNMALSRAFYFSFILQRAQDDLEPGFLYYSLSTIADVAANRFVNSSAIYYGPHFAFTPSYKGFYNKTMPLFAPRAYRADDFNDPYHLQGTSTLNTIEVTDLGAIPNNSMSSNYTHDQYKINQWYKSWLPDLTKRHDSKTTYTVQIIGAYKNETFVWHGPPAPSDIPGPIKWPQPYFDCGRSNKWVYGATSPIPDIYPRHTGWRHIEIPIYVATASIEIDYERLDINQCPIGKGNPGPNYFAGTARCKNTTTECEPIHGYGFRRGGYQCRCKPGHRLPRVVRTPYLGEVIERATQWEHERGFNCERIGYIAVRTQTVEKLTEAERNKYLARIETWTGMKGNISDSARIDPLWIQDYMKSIKADNCQKILRDKPDRLILRGDVSYGKEEHLENQARMAIRLANFISAFLQLVDPKEVFGEFRVPDKPLTEDQVIGEALATVIGDGKIQGCGVFFERNHFPNRTAFAPYAYRKDKNSRTYYVDDLSRHHPGSRNYYLQRDYYQKLKTRWASNTDELEQYTAKINIRYNSSGLYTIRYDHYPLQYKAAELRHGYWTSPYFDCDGIHKNWIITYAVPFFGWDKIQSRLEFKGIVAVSVQLDELYISQCDDGYYVSNAFKNTHKCDRSSSRCVPILGRRYEPGGYKCECLQGFEYPYNDAITYFDGQILESEYMNLVADQQSRFDTLKCRIAAAPNLKSFSSVTLLTLLLLTSICSHLNFYY